MFWNYNQSSSPQIDNIFCKEDLTLQELLDQENILQELKSQNKKLIDFLIKPDVLSELVTLITTEPDESLPEQDRYKHANIACELLTTDIPSLTETLTRDTNLLTKLYSFLETQPPLNPLLASFFSRAMGVLVVRRSEQNWYSYQFTCLQVLEFLKSKETSVSLLLNHLGTSAIMDFVLKLVTQIEGIDMRQNILNFLAAQGLVSSLVDLLAPGVDAGLTSNAALLLCDIIVKCREAQNNCENKPEPDPILSSLESNETIKKILEVVLAGDKKESSIVGGICVLLTLLEPFRPIGGGGMSNMDSGGMMMAYGGLEGGGGASGDSPAPSPPPPVTLMTTEAIVPYLPLFHDILLNPPLKPAVKMTCCVVDPPLGNSRLHVVKLLVALISTHNPLVQSQLAALDTLQVLLDLFFRYSWNNFLHTQVEKCLNTALAVDPLPSDNPTDNLLLDSIFVKCKLLKRILDAWNENDEQCKNGSCRKGYMGHLTRISLTINCQLERGLGNWVQKHLSEAELSEWQDFTSGPLVTVKAQLDTCLGGKHPALSSSDDDERNYRNIPFQQDSQFQQLFTEKYQTQQMAPQFIENFGYHDNDFNDSEDNLNPAVDRLAHLSFSVTDDEELERQAEMFDQVCAQKMRCLDADDNDDEEVWADHNLASRTWNGGEEIANYNSSDDEDRPGPDEERQGPEGREAVMDIDQADPWLGDSTAAPVVDGPVDPWGGESTLADNAGWADFDSNFVAVTMSPSLSFDTVPADASLDTPTLNTSEEIRSEPIGASCSDIKEDGLDKRDDNANLSLTSLCSEDPKCLDEETLIDNFRFLSTQGLIAGKSEVPSDPTPAETNPKPPESSEEQAQAGTQETESPAPDSSPAPAPATPTPAPAETV